MKYKALRSFCGVINARPGQELEITDKALAKDLMGAGYIEPMEKPEPAPVTAVKKTAKKAAKKADAL